MFSALVSSQREPGSSALCERKSELEEGGVQRGDTSCRLLDWWACTLRCHWEEEAEMALSGGDEEAVLFQATSLPVSVSGIGAFSRVLILVKMASIGADTDTSIGIGVPLLISICQSKMTY